MVYFLINKKKKKTEKESVTVGLWVVTYIYRTIVCHYWTH